MNASEIRELGTEEVRKELEQARENLFNLRFRFATSQLRDHNVLKAARRDIARLETIVHERERAGEG
ncbi:MAG: 50S ribosomal protein L29 [Anaerolineae bacterium]|nr:50S ribosomal protein L29 [Anaerolineae bacterium]